MEKSILELIGEPAMLEQLAEECTELAKAALKKARAIRKENPTPIDVRDAGLAVREEFTDVMICANELNLVPSDAVRRRKLSRWHERLREAGKARNITDRLQAGLRI